jgi:hypothetical protein
MYVPNLAMVATGGVVGVLDAASSPASPPPEDEAEASSVAPPASFVDPGPADDGDEVDPPHATASAGREQRRRASEERGRGRTPWLYDREARERRLPRVKKDDFRGFQTIIVCHHWTHGTFDVAWGT